MSIEPDLLEKFVPVGTYSKHREQDMAVRNGMEERLRSAELSIKELQTARRFTEGEIDEMTGEKEKKEDRGLNKIGLWIGVAGILASVVMSALSLMR